MSTKPKRPQTGWYENINKTISPERHDSSREESLSSLPEGEWAVAKSQRGMTQDKVKTVCQGATTWKTGIFLRGKFELFTGGWVSCCWVPKRDDAGWSQNCMPKCNALKNEHLPNWKGWALYRRGSEVLLSPKEGWRREWEDPSKHFNVVSTLLLGWYDVATSHNVKSTLKQRCVRQRWNLQHSTTLKQSCVFQRWIEQH